MNLSSNVVPSGKRYHRIDGWRGYRMPKLAIVGASDTGMWSDSPCPSDDVRRELNRFVSEVLRPAGIKQRRVAGSSSNAFCGKRWIVVSAEDFPRAAQLAVDWVEKNKYDTRYIHTADLEEIGYKPSEVN